MEFAAVSLTCWQLSHPFYHTVWCLPIYNIYLLGMLIAQFFVCACIIYRCFNCWTNPDEIWLMGKPQVDNVIGWVSTPYPKPCEPKMGSQVAFQHHKYSLEYSSFHICFKVKSLFCKKLFKTLAIRIFQKLSFLWSYLLHKDEPD